MEEFTAVISSALNFVTGESEKERGNFDVENDIVASSFPSLLSVA